MANFSLNNTAPTSDPSRDYLFDLIFPSLPAKVAGLTSEEIKIRAQSVNLVGRGNETIEVPFYQMKAFYAGKPTFGSNQFKVGFNEFEDRKVSTFLYSWQELIFNSKTTGASTAASKLEYSVPTVLVGLKDFKMNTLKTDGKQFQFKNVWIEAVDDVEYAWTNSGHVTYSATFRFDYWEYAA